MDSGSAKRLRLLVLGSGVGWHADQLSSAAARQGHRLEFADYESLEATVGATGIELGCSVDAASLTDFDAILARTMPAGSMERITFRLAVLHAIADQLVTPGIPIVNPPRAMEWSIDKFAALARLVACGVPVPPTRFVQNRAEAMQAFEQLGGDCVVKPIFGGEGRGVMRVADSQLAWYSFSTLDHLGAVLQIQTFIPPGGRDTRLLVIGDRVLGVRRINEGSFRSNVAAGAATERAEVDPPLAATARRIAQRFGLVFASIDLIDNDDGPPLFLEVNAIPGWKGAQRVHDASIADAIIETLSRARTRTTPK